METTLLNKTRTINKLIQRAAGNPVDFEEMAKVLGQAVIANCYIVGRRGKILGYSFMEGFACGVMEDIVIHTERFPESYNEGLMKISSTITNTTQVANGCVFNSNEPCGFTNKLTTIVPILGGGERVGTLVLAKYDVEFNEHDLVLAEYGATVVGMEILRVKA
ncbi:MAG TPA: GTP-sensing pleiotropic transcriptional regulator CodY, partial [Desulfosporosinus sp.]|nr:GTP-sensing pleiotropic transcriptional regulator CodY [Desulfosporosinus sp.]